MEDDTYRPNSCRNLSAQYRTGPYACKSKNYAAEPWVGHPYVNGMRIKRYGNIWNQIDKQIKTLKKEGKPLPTWTQDFYRDSFSYPEVDYCDCGVDEDEDEKRDYCNCGADDSEDDEEDEKDNDKNNKESEKKDYVRRSNRAEQVRDFANEWMETKVMALRTYSPMDKKRYKITRDVYA